MLLTASPHSSSWIGIAQAASPSGRARADALLEKAGQLYLKRQYTAGRDLCEQALRLAPGYARAYLGLGLILSRMGEKNRAGDTLWKVRTAGGTRAQIAKAEAELRRLGQFPKRYTTITQTQWLPFNTIKTTDISLPVDGSRIVQPGRRGKRQSVIQIQWHGARKIGSRILSQRVVQRPVARIVAFGAWNGSQNARRFIRVVLNEDTPLVSNAPFFNAGGQMLLPLADIMTGLGWQKDYDAATQELRWTKEGVVIRHRLGTSTVTRVMPGGDNEERLVLTAPSREKSLEGRDVAFVPSDFFRQVANLTPDFDVANATFHLRSVSALSSSVVSGTIETVDYQGVQLSTMEGEVKLTWSPTFTAQRWLSDDANASAQALASTSTSFEAPEGASPATSIEISDLSEGEAVRVVMAGGQTNNLIAIATLQPERLLRSEGTSLFLSARPDKAVTIGEKLSYRSRSGVLTTTADVPDNSPVAVLINPLTRRMFRVSAFASDVAASGSASTSPPSLSKAEWGTARAPLSLSSDRRWLVTGEATGGLLLWDKTIRLVRRLAGGDGRAALSAAWSRDGKALAVGRSDGSIAIWRNTPSGPNETPDAVWATPDSGPAAFVAWSPDGGLLASGHRGANGTRSSINLWNAPSGRLLSFAPSLITSCQGLLWLPPTATKSSRLLVADGNFPLTAYEINTRLERAIADLNFSDASLRSVNGLVYVPQSHLIIAGDTNGTLHSWSLTAPERDRRNSLKWGVATPVATSALTVSPDGKSIIQGSADGTVRWWELSTRSLRTVNIPKGPQAISDLLILPTGQLAITSARNDEMRVVDP